MSAPDEQPRPEGLAPAAPAAPVPSAAPPVCVPLDVPIPFAWRFVPHKPAAKKPGRPRRPPPWARFQRDWIQKSAARARPGPVRSIMTAVLVPCACAPQPRG